MLTQAQPSKNNLKAYQLSMENPGHYYVVINTQTGQTSAMGGAVSLLDDMKGGGTTPLARQWREVPSVGLCTPSLANFAIDLLV